MPAGLVLVEQLPELKHRIPESWFAGVGPPVPARKSEAVDIELDSAASGKLVRRIAGDSLLAIVQQPDCSSLESKRMQDCPAQNYLRMIDCLDRTRAA